MTTEFYESSWGGVRVWLAGLRTTAGRDQVVHELARGDVPVVQDRGRVARRARCELLFDDMIGATGTPLERLQRFAGLVDDGTPRILTHPIYGSFLAAVGDFEHEINADGIITASCEFIATEAVQAVVPVGPGAGSWTGDAAVLAWAKALDAELDAVGDSTTVTAAATAASDSWLDQAKHARDVLVDVGSLSSRIADEIDEKKLEADIALWPVLKAYILLDDASRSAAEATMGGAASALFSVQVAEPTSLRSLMARIYGGSSADDRYTDALDLNDIPTPGRIPTGTVLKLPAPPVQARSG